MKVCGIVVTRKVTIKGGGGEGGAKYPKDFALCVATEYIPLLDLFFQASMQLPGFCNGTITFIQRYSKNWNLYLIPPSQVSPFCPRSRPFEPPARPLSVHAPLSLRIRR